MYTPPGYRLPKLMRPAWNGAERRSLTPLNQLSRALDGLCTEAADPLEIAAHLEALGYDDLQRLKMYGMADHFMLAEVMFRQTPRRRVSRPNPGTRRLDGKRAIVMVLTLLATIGASVITGTHAWAPVIFLLGWSQVGSALLARVEQELGDEQRRPFLSMLVRAGLLGLLLTWILVPFDNASGTVALLWLGVTSLVWNRQAPLALALPLVMAILLFAHHWLSLSIPLMLLSMLLAASCLTARLLAEPRQPDWRWLRSQLTGLLPFLSYGLGQAFLLMGLLAGAGDRAHVLPGVILFIGIMLFFDRHLLLLHSRLSRHLWNETSKERYGARARRSLIAYASTYLLPAVPVLLIWSWLGPQPWFHHWLGFSLLALTLGLALTFLNLGDSRTPAVIFSIAGPLTLFAPFLAITVVVVLLQLMLLVHRTRNLGQFGVHLL
jgi:hypothetical protein